MRAYGDVQRVGYRYVVQDIARKMGVKGYVKNLPDGSVEIVAESSKEMVDKFVEAVKFREPPIDVVRLDVVYAEATGEHKFFNMVSGDLIEEIVEGFGTGLKYINLSRDETKQGLQKVEGSIEEVCSDVRAMHKDVQGSIQEVGRNIKVMHEDLEGSIGEMHKGLKDEIVGVRSEVRDMHMDMSKSFDEMAKRYDVISSELVRTREELTRAVDGLLKVIEEFIQERRGADRTGRKE